MSASTSNFVSDDGDGIKVYVEHGDLGSETMTFIHGIARDVWFEDVDPDDEEYVKKMNPTLRYWKKHKHPKKPDIHITKGRFRLVPPQKLCLLGPDPQYEERGELKLHPACKCERCTQYSYYRWNRSDWANSSNFWNKITDRLQINV